jgi:hypothetical protein
MQKYISIVVLLGVTLLAVVACESGAAPATQPTATAVSTRAAVPTAASATVTPGPVGAGATAAATTAATAGPVNTPNNSVPTVDPKAANTSFQTAKTIGKDPIKLSFKDSEFFYKIDIARGGIVSATLSVDAFSPEPAKLSLYGETQNYIDEITVAVAKGGQFTHIFNSKGGGTVFLTLRGNSSVTLVAQALAQNDGGSKGDAGEDFDSAAVVPLGQINGQLRDDDTEDNFNVDLPKTGGVLNISLKTADGNVKLSVYDEGRNYLGEMTADKNNPEPGVFQHVLAAGQGGHWFLAMSGSGAYAMNAAFGKQNDAGSGKDAGGDFDSALTIKPGNYSGLVGGPDTDDQYAFDLGKTGGVLSVTVKTPDGAVKGTIYDEGRNYIGEISADKTKTGATSYRYVLAEAQGGRWFLDVTGEGSYAFTVGFAAQNDGGSGKDAGDNSATAVIPKTADFTGTIGDADTNDYFKITASMGRKINVQYLGGIGSLKATLYDKGENYLKEASIDPGGSVDLVEDSETASDYFVVISNANGDYRIKVTR